MNYSPTINHISLLMMVLMFAGCSDNIWDATDLIKTENKRIEQAFLSLDAKTIAEIYTTDGRMYPPGKEVVSGKENIIAHWKLAFESGIDGVKLETISAEGHGNTIIEEGRFTIYKNNQVVSKGKTIIIWKKEDGVWKYQKDIWNSHPID